MRMTSIFLVLVGVALGSLLTALGTGMAAWGDLDGSGLARHRQLALGCAILLVLVHSMVFVYMIGTGRAIKDAVRDHGIAPRFYEVHKGYKWRAAPWAMAGALLTVVTAVLGGAVATGSGAAWAHPLAGVMVLAANLFGLPEIWKAIRDNGRLLNEVAAATAAVNREVIARGEDPAPPLSTLPRTRWYLILAGSSWLPWLYMRYVMGGRHTAWWPFAAACGLFLLLWLREVLRSGAERRRAG